MRLVIVIVNYRTPALVIDCLRSLQPEVTPGQDTVVVVDNASGDNSVAEIAAAIAQEHWQPWVSLLPSDWNGGFAAGNNLAIWSWLQAPEPPQFFLLLNPDTVVRPGAVGTLVEFLEQHPQVGLAGSRLEDPDGTPQRSAFRFHSLLGEVESGLRWGFVTRLLEQWVVAPPLPQQRCQVDWVSGACMLVRAEIFTTVGLMDQQYFMYYEEVDFCWQARRAGWTCWYVPESRVVHLVGQSSGVDDPRRLPQRRPQYWFNSRQRFFTKNYGRSYTWVANVAWATGHALWRLRRPLQGKPDLDPPYLLQDFLQHSFLGGSPKR